MFYHHRADPEFLAIVMNSCIRKETRRVERLLGFKLNPYQLLNMLVKCPVDCTTPVLFIFTRRSIKKHISTFAITYP